MTTDGDFTELIEQTKADEEREAAERRWRWAIKRECHFWHQPQACPACHQWVGHFGGDATRDPCPVIPQDVPLEEVRPNRYVVRRAWIGDAIRAALEKRHG